MFIGFKQSYYYGGKVKISSEARKVRGKFQKGDGYRNGLGIS